MVVETMMLPLPLRIRNIGREKMPKYIEAEALEKQDWLLVKTDGWNKAYFMKPTEVPAADVRENVRAHWVIEREQLPNGEIAVGQFCSNCDYPQYLTTKFCPNCGAVMDEREEDDEKRFTKSD